MKYGGGYTLDGTREMAYNAWDFVFTWADSSDSSLIKHADIYGTCSSAWFTFVCYRLSVMGFVIIYRGWCIATVDDEHWG